MRLRIIFILLLLMWVTCLYFKDESRVSKIEPVENKTVQCDTFYDTVVLNHAYFSKKQYIY